MKLILMMLTLCGQPHQIIVVTKEKTHTYKVTPELRRSKEYHLLFNNADMITVIKVMGRCS